MTDTAVADMAESVLLSKSAAEIVKAKVGVILDDVFFATLLLHAGLHPDTTIDTMCTDGEHVYYSPKFVLEHSVPEIKAVIVHEIFHIIFDDGNRVGTRDPERWNIACDIRINRLMDDTKRGSTQAYYLPNEAVRNNALYDAGQGIAEAIYELLPKDKGGGGKGQGKGQGGGGYQPGKGWNDLRQPQNKTQAERDAMAQEWKLRTAQAANAAKAVGNLPAHIERLVTEVLKPRVDWRHVMRRFMGARARVEWSYASPRYTLLDMGIIMPSLGGERLGRIWCAVDVSGSISDYQKDEFAAELGSIWNDLRPDGLDTVFFSHHVTGHDHLDRDEEFTFNARGGGGTAIKGVFDLIAQQAEQPEVLVVLTDLFIPDIPDPPGYPVLWVCNYPGKTAPWGETVFMDVPKEPG